MYYRDLDNCGYFNLFGHDFTKILHAVGWLDPDNPYPRGEVPLEFLRKLVSLMTFTWAPSFFLGNQPCLFCEPPGEIEHFEFEEQIVKIGTRNLFVPTQSGVFVAPSLILHYIKEHHYAPPDIFQKAVLSCPPIWKTGSEGVDLSAEYSAALKASNFDPEEVIKPGKNWRPNPAFEV